MTRKTFKNTNPFAVTSQLAKEDSLKKVELPKKMEKNDEKQTENKKSEEKMKNENLTKEEYKKNSYQSNTNSSRSNTNSSRNYINNNSRSNNRSGNRNNTNNSRNTAQGRDSYQNKNTSINKSKDSSPTANQRESTKRTGYTERKGPRPDRFSDRFSERSNDKSKDRSDRFNKSSTSTTSSFRDETATSKNNQTLQNIIKEDTTDTKNSGKVSQYENRNNTQRNNTREERINPNKDNINIQNTEYNSMNREINKSNMNINTNNQQNLDQNNSSNKNIVTNNFTKEESNGKLEVSAQSDGSNDTLEGVKKLLTLKHDASNGEGSSLGDSLADLIQTVNLANATYKNTTSADVKTNFEWKDLEMHQLLIDALKERGFERPSPVQKEVLQKYKTLQAEQQAVPNLVVRAKNGTGKTLSYLLPLIDRFLWKDTTQKATQDHFAIVLVPTRELAMQIGKVSNNLVREINQTMKNKGESAGSATNSRFGFCLLPSYGGTNLHDDILRLRQGVNGVISTPGRILDLLSRKVIKKVDLLILDEADKLLSWEYGNTLDNIIDKVQENNLESNKNFNEKSADSNSENLIKDGSDKKGLSIQLFSATFPLPVNNFVQQRVNHPVFINLMKENYLLALSQFYCRVAEEHKITCLVHLLNILVFNQAIIYCNSAKKAEALANLLMRKYTCLYLHGRMDQEERNRVYHAFVGSRVKHANLEVNQSEKTANFFDSADISERMSSTQKKGTFKNNFEANQQFGVNHVQLLVSTDLTTRGIDVPDLNLVINFEFPFSIESYIHRIGRTGRFGSKGVSISFIGSDEEMERLREIEGKVGKEIKSVGENDFQKFCKNIE